MTDTENKVIKQVVDFQNQLVDSLKAAQAENSALRAENDKLRGNNEVINPLISPELKDDQVSELMDNYLKNK